MATDLREKQRPSSQPVAIRRRSADGDPRWPYVATAIVLVVVAAVTALVLAQGTSRTPASREVWRRNVEGMMTDVREGSGYAPATVSAALTYVHGLEHAGAYAVIGVGTEQTYANGALTGDREGSGFVTYVPTVTGHFPGPGSYPSAGSTEIEQGTGSTSLGWPKSGPLPGHGAYGAPTTDGRCP